MRSAYSIPSKTRSSRLRSENTDSVDISGSEQIMPESTNEPHVVLPKEQEVASPKDKDKLVANRPNRTTRSKSVGSEAAPLRISTTTPSHSQSQSLLNIGIYSKEKPKTVNVETFKNEGLERTAKNTSRTSFHSQKSIHSVAEEEEPVPFPASAPRSEGLVPHHFEKPRSRSGSHSSSKAPSVQDISEQEEPANVSPVDVTVTFAEPQNAQGDSHHSQKRRPRASSMTREPSFSMIQEEESQ
jgi:hypothetical protein